MQLRLSGDPRPPWGRVLAALDLVRGDVLSPMTHNAVAAITVEALAAARRLQGQRARG